jgi:hypothetical protein
VQRQLFSIREETEKKREATMCILNSYVSGDDVSNVYNSYVWGWVASTKFLKYFITIFEKIKIITSCIEYIKYSTILHAGITKLVNGAGLFRNISLINRIQDLFIILSVD